MVKELNLGPASIFLPLLLILMLEVVKSPAVLVLRMVTGGLVVVMGCGVEDLAGLSLLKGLLVVLNPGGNLNRGLQEPKFIFLKCSTLLKLKEKSEI